MERRTEFPALEARKEYLEHEFYSAQKMANDAAYAGKPDGGIQQWIASVKAELDELRYVLRVLSTPDGRIEVSGRTALLIGSILVVIFLVQIFILLNLGPR